MPVVPELCSGLGTLFGGCGLGAAIEVLEQATGRPLVWATAQYLSFARPPSVLHLDATEVVRGHQISQARVVGAGDVRAQTRQVLENVRAIVEAAGGALRDVIKTTVYLTDIAHHGAMNEVYALFFLSEFPARTTVQVAGLAPALTGDGHPFLVEIDAVAWLGAR